MGMPRPRKIERGMLLLAPPEGERNGAVVWTAVTDESICRIDKTEKINRYADGYVPDGWIVLDAEALGEHLYGLSGLNDLVLEGSR